MAFKFLNDHTIKQNHQIYSTVNRYSLIIRNIYLNNLAQYCYRP